MPVLTWLRNGIQRRALARFPRLSRGKTTRESSADQIPEDRPAQVNREY
jgi:hypothetical protein